MTRQCAYKIDAINCYLNSDVQTPLQLRTKIQESCTKMSSECSSALVELAIGVRTMTCSPSTDVHIQNAKTAAHNTTALLRTGVWPDADFLHIIPAVTVASLLIEVVSCTAKIADSVNELASLAKFKKPDPTMNKQASLQKVKRIPSIESSHTVQIALE